MAFKRSGVRSSLAPPNHLNQTEKRAAFSGPFLLSVFHGLLVNYPPRSACCTGGLGLGYLMMVSGPIISVGSHVDRIGI